MTAEIRPPTLGRVRAALGRRGLRPRRRLGQNFLTDASILASIVDAAEIGADDVVLEVGPGPGTLTAELLGRGARVVAVELDEQMIDVLHELIGRPPGLTVVRADILENHPDLPATVAAALDRGQRESGRQSFGLVANLPYQVAARFLVDLVWGRPPDRAVVTVQHEVAERLVARPGTADYGPLSVLVQLTCDVEVTRRIPPGAFWPRPKVDSACVVLSPRPLDPLAADLPASFLIEVAHAVFFARRKSLANSLALAFRGRIERARLAEIMAEKKLEKGRRGERLTPMEIVELAVRLKEEFSPPGA